MEAQPPGGFGSATLCGHLLPVSWFSLSRDHSTQGQDTSPCFSWWCLALARQEVTQSLPQVCLLEPRWHGHRAGLQTCKGMGRTRSFLAPSTPWPGAAAP